MNAGQSCRSVATSGLSARHDRRRLRCSAGEGRGCCYQTVSARNWKTANCGVFSSFSQRPSGRSEEHTSELQSQSNLVCRLLLEKKKQPKDKTSVRQQLLASTC